MTWILWGVMGAISLVSVNTFVRMNPWGLSFWSILMLMVVPTTLGTQFGFLKFFQTAPSFLSAWFIGIGLDSILGFAASVFIFREQANFMNGLGVGLVLLGGFLLTR
jgi:hypothetical protein